MIVPLAGGVTVSERMVVCVPMRSTSPPGARINSNCGALDERYAVLPFLGASRLSDGPFRYVFALRAKAPGGRPPSFEALSLGTCLPKVTVNGG